MVAATTATSMRSKGVAAMVTAGVVAVMAAARVVVVTQR